MTSLPPDRIELSDDARDDLAALYAHLFERNPSAAAAFLGRVGATLDLLAAKSPRLDGAPVEMRDGRPCRRFPAHPAVILYDRAPDVLAVLRVYHHAREPLTRE